MKKPLILLTAMLMSVACLGQSMPTQSTLCRSCDSCRVYDAPVATYAPNTFQLPPSYTNYWTIKNTYSLSVNGDGKELMQVTDRDPKTGEFKVWVNRKQMVWTSDSTFVLLSKPKK